MRTKFHVVLASYACPLVNPPAQRHLFENKIHNIQLAIGRMLPLVLQPGQNFSFWQYALEPIVENGYRDGAMFVNQKVTTSVGGGLCQLSGLIYNLALLSGLEIVERHNHSIDAYGEERYIPLGRDATVAHGHKDLQFRNSQEFPIELELRVNEKEASGIVRGTRALNFAVSIETELTRTIPARIKTLADPTLGLGEEIVEPGLTGKIVHAWRICESPGQPPRRQHLSRDRYRETRTIRRMGSAGAVPWTARVLARLGWHG